MAAFLAASITALVLASGAAARPLFGTWSPGEPYAGSVARADALERATGRRVDIVNWFQNWGGNAWITSVQSQAVRAVTGSGRAPLLTWEPRDPQLGAEQPTYALARIADGTHDAYIASFARSLRALGAIVFLRPMHEMNGTWYPWGGGVNSNTAAQFLQAWRRMHDIFAAEGAGNVRWVWSPNNFDVSPAFPLEAFYPGGSYVDVLAADGYNWGTTRPQFGGWQSFDQVFRPVYNRLRALGPQPIWFAEVGSAPDGGDKAAWVRDMFARAQGMDRLEAIVWFNELKELDWRADADPAVAAAFTPPAPGSSYPLLTDDGSDAIPGTTSSTAVPASTSTTGSASTTESSSATGTGQRSHPRSIPVGGAVLAGGTDADSAAAHPGLAQFLRVYADMRVFVDRRSTVRWEVKATRRVRRWVVFLDGRRVHSVRAGRERTHRLRRRVTRVGTHRWRVEGRDARGRRAVSAGRTFRVVRAR